LQSAGTQFLLQLGMATAGRSAIARFLVQRFIRIKRVVSCWRKV
jgi:hypothetical protein